MAMLRTIAAVQAVSVMLMMLFASSAHAENEEAETTDSVPGLDLFDEDAEETRKGWSQLHVSAGIMYLDADKTDYVQVYDIDFAGPMIFARFRF
jgi:hypothetical protein